MMKSQKAKELIEKYAVGNSRDAAPSMMRGRAVECVEIAEQEAEERMREKAIEAFKSSCKYKDDCGGIGRDCHPALCEDLRSFIQKLDEI
jgi:hypothetical protein